MTGQDNIDTFMWLIVTMEKLSMLPHKVIWNSTIVSGGDGKFIRKVELADY